MGWCLLKKEPGVALSRLVEQLLELSGHPLGDFKVAPHWIRGPPWTHALLWGCWSWWSRGHASHVASVCFGALNSFKMDLSRSPSIRTPLSLQYKSISSILVWGTHEPISRFSIQLSLKVKLFFYDYSVDMFSKPFFGGYACRGDPSPIPCLFIYTGSRVVDKKREQTQYRNLNWRYLPYIRPM